MIRLRFTANIVIATCISILIRSDDAAQVFAFSPLVTVAAVIIRSALIAIYVLYPKKEVSAVLWPNFASASCEVSRCSRSSFMDSPNKFSLLNRGEFYLLDFILIKAYLFLLDEKAVWLSPIIHDK